MTGALRKFGYPIILVFLMMVDLALGSLVDPTILWVRTDLFDMLIPSPVARNATYEYGLKKSFQTRVRFGSTNFPVVTDQHGFRFFRTRRNPAKASTEKWLIIGDSFTFGSGVAYGETFAGRIDEKRPGIEVMNAAVESYSPANYLAKLVFLVGEQQIVADEAIVFIDISDPIDELSRRVSAAGKVDALEKSPGGAETAARLNSAIDKAKGFRGVRQWLRDHSLIVRGAYEIKDFFLPPPRHRRRFDPEIMFVKGMWTANADLMDRYANDGLTRSAEHLTRLAGFLKTRGIDLTIAVYPWPHQILIGDVEPVQVTFWRRWAACHGARFVDLFPPFFVDDAPQDTIDRFFLAGDVRWNASGHLLIANEFLRRRAASGVPKPSEEC